MDFLGTLARCSPWARFWGGVSIGRLPAQVHLAQRAGHQSGWSGEWAKGVLDPGACGCKGQGVPRTWAQCPGGKQAWPSPFLLADVLCLCIHLAFPKGCSPAPDLGCPPFLFLRHLPLLSFPTTNPCTHHLLLSVALGFSLLILKCLNSLFPDIRPLQWLRGDHEKPSRETAQKGPLVVSFFKAQMNNSTDH